MASDLVFITGGTGFIGLHVILQALQTGRHVRAAIRNKSGESRILDALKRAGLGSDKLSNITFVVIPDILDPNAYTNHLDNVKEIIHVASPLPAESDDYKKSTVDPAVNGTINILNAALKYPAITRVVITSSFVVLADLGKPISKDTYSEETKATSIVYEKSQGANPGTAYRASKILAHQATEKFLSENKYGDRRQFVVATIHPSFVLGINYLQDEYDPKLTGTNRMIWQIVQPLDGTDGQPVPPTVQSTVSVHDVAEAHIKALTVDVRDKNKPEEFALCGPTDSWDDVEGLVKKNFPEYASKDIYVFKKKEGEPIKVDRSKTESKLGIKFKSFEDQVKEVVKQHTELYLKHKGK